MATAATRVFLPTRGLVIGWIGVVVAVGFGLLLVATSPSRGGLLSALLLFGFGWLVWVVLSRPRVRVRNADIELVNSMRSTTIPGELVDTVRMRAYLELAVGDRRYICAAIGHKGKALVRGDADRARGLVTDEPGKAPYVDNPAVRVQEVLQETVDAAHRRPRPEPGGVRVHWDVIPLAVLALVVAAAVVTALV